MTIKIDDDLPDSTVNPGWKLGWGVFQENPWKLFSVHSTEKGALEYRETLLKTPSDIEVAYGEHRVGSDEFMKSGKNEYPA